jgi:hypothetical protein
MQEAAPKEPQKFFVRNGVLITDEEFVKRMNEVYDEIYRNTRKNQSNWIYVDIPSVEIKTYDD